MCNIKNFILVLRNLFIQDLNYISIFKILNLNEGLLRNLSRLKVTF